MDWLNLPGLLAMLMLLAPNILYAARHPNARKSCRSKGLLVLEQIGRYGCMVLMCLPMGLLAYGYAAPGWAVVWLTLATTLVFVYWAVWVLYFRKAGIACALTLALVPAALFLLSGLLWRNIPLVALSLLFGYAHTRITAVNARQDAC